MGKGREWWVPIVAFVSFIFLQNRPNGVGVKCHCGVFLWEARRVEGIRKDGLGVHADGGRPRTRFSTDELGRTFSARGVVRLDYLWRCHRLVLGRTVGARGFGSRHLWRCHRLVLGRTVGAWGGSRTVGAFGGWYGILMFAWSGAPTGRAMTAHGNAMGNGPNKVKSPEWAI